MNVRASQYIYTLMDKLKHYCNISILLVYNCATCIRILFAIMVIVPYQKLIVGNHMDTMILAGSIIVILAMRAEDCVHLRCVCTRHTVRYDTVYSYGTTVYTI